MIRFHIPICILLGLVGPLAAHDREGQALTSHLVPQSEPSWSVSTGWQSRYFIEGRDALDGDGIWHQALEWSDGPLAVGAWYGDSTGGSYDELQLSAAYAHTFGSVDAYLSYTHVRTPIDGGHDHEFGTGFVFTGCPTGIEFALDAYYSEEENGVFAEASATYGWVLGDKLHAELTGILGMNQNYVADGHDGANHFALTFSLAYALTEGISLTAHATQSWALDRESSAAGDEQLKDFFHAGIGVTCTF